MDTRHRHGTGPDRATACISLDDIAYGVNGQPILRDITLKIDAKRIGIVGRNGSGKSTLARVLAGLIAPDTGRLRVNGIDPAQNRRTALAEIGILFQNPDHQIIFPTVAEEIAFGLRQQGCSKPAAEQKCRETLLVFGKAHWGEAHIETLSQGQKHLLCLMAVAAMAPRMIILDEPFTGLDIPTRMQLKRYLDIYTGAVVHITHAPEDLAGYERVIWLEDGVIAATGTSEQVLAAYLERMQQLGTMDDISHLAD